MPTYIDQALTLCDALIAQAKANEAEFSAVFSPVNKGELQRHAKERFFEGKANAFLNKNPKQLREALAGLQRKFDVLFTDPAERALAEDLKEVLDKTSEDDGFINADDSNFEQVMRAREAREAYTRLSSEKRQLIDDIMNVSLLLDPAKMQDSLDYHMHIGGHPLNDFEFSIPIPPGIDLTVATHIFQEAFKRLFEREHGKPESHISPLGNESMAFDEIREHERAMRDVLNITVMKEPPSIIVGRNKEGGIIDWAAIRAEIDGTIRRELNNPALWQKKNSIFGKTYELDYKGPDTPYAYELLGAVYEADKSIRRHVKQVAITPGGLRKTEDDLFEEFDKSMQEQPANQPLLGEDQALHEMFHHYHPSARISGPAIGKILIQGFGIDEKQLGAQRGR